ncbi:TPA: hypothetical protein ACODIZ_003654 [Salmonella enterica subsp. enterica serovar Newport]
MANNYTQGGPHTSSYWQEVARTMDAVNAKTADLNLNPQGHTEAQKPNGLNKPEQAKP